MSFVDSHRIYDSFPPFLLFTPIKKRYNDFKIVDQSAKKVSLAIIVILAVTIGGIWYVRQPKSVTVVKPVSATSTKPVIAEVKLFATGQNNLTTIVVDQLDEVLASAKAKLPSEQPRTITTQYQLTNLKITADVSTSSLRRYGLALVSALKPYGTDRQNEIALMLSALNQKDQTKVSQLIATVTTNKQVVASLLNVLVPRNLMNFHLALINHLSEGIALLTDMSLILDNPYLALSSADLYRVQKLSFYNDIGKINGFFKESGIVFTEAESGQVFKN